MKIRVGNKTGKGETIKGHNVKKGFCDRFRNLGGFFFPTQFKRYHVKRRRSSQQKEKPNSPLCTYSAIKMALRLAMLKSAGGTAGWTLPFRRWAHATALPLPLDTAISSQIPSPPLVLPEFDRNGDTTNYNNNSEFGFPSFSFAGSMELMAVPKKKVILFFFFKLL